MHNHGLVAVGSVLAARDLVVDQHVAAVEPGLQAAAGKLRHQAGDHLVETLAARLGRQLQGDGVEVDAVAEIAYDFVVMQVVERTVDAVRRCIQL